MGFLESFQELWRTGKGLPVGNWDIQSSIALFEDWSFVLSATTRKLHAAT